MSPRCGLARKVVKSSIDPEQLNFRGPMK